LNKKRILVIEDDESTGESLEIFLTELGFDVRLATNGKDGFNSYIDYRPDLILSDIIMPGWNGLELLKKIKNINPNAPVILITGVEKSESIILAMQLGAYDYIEKPIDINNLRITIEHALETNELSQKLNDVNIEIPGYQAEPDLLVGKSTGIKEILKQIGQISSSKVNVLIQGESGTGKELISRMIHNSGITKNKPFVAVNSATIPEHLLESELFGHVKGAFTDAFRDKKGKFEMAGQGTILLDEIGDIAPSLQAKLLRVIQEREFEQVGGEETIPLNARIIVATNKDLESLVKQGKFREDLYYRLNVFNINIPPLRERKNDIPLLMVYFVNKINVYLDKRVTKIPYEVVEMLQSYHWPGNVRELENVLMQAIVLAKGEVIEKQNILLNRSYNHEHNSGNENLSLAELEKMHIKLVLDKVNWNKKEAAKILKISKQTLYNKIKTLKIYPS
jgi:two-component system, NtrC family, response regulator AtoC